MSLGRSSRFYFLGLAKMKSEKCYLPLHLHPPSPFNMVVSCVTGPLTRMLVRPWWMWKCSSSWGHAQALRVIIGSNWDSSQFPRQCYDLFNQWINSLVLGSSPVTRIIPSICILFPACTANVPFYHGSLPSPVISKFIHCVVFNKVIHIIQVWVCHSTDPLQTIVVNCLMLVWRVSMISESKVILFAT